jgi:CubicO group peptidase (beta-lactamase class C family)
VLKIYFLLSVILENFSGKPSEQLLRERIFEPLAMNAIGLRLHPASSRKARRRL